LIIRLPRALAVAVVAAWSALAPIPAAAQAPRATISPQPIEIRAQAIDSFDPREPGRTGFGKLQFRGGLALDSSHRDFGGVSSIRVMADGEQFLAVTDKGNWLRGRIVSRDGRPIAIRHAEIAPMLGADGRPLRRRGWYDAEALAEDGGVVHVGIERVNQILRFDYGKDGLRARGQPVAVPPAFRSLPHNQGVECLAALPGGTLVAIAERALDAGGNLLGFLIGRAGGAFSLKRTDDFDVSDCAVTPRGELLVLERRFSWLRGLGMRIRSVPLADVKPGALLDGPALITGDLAHQIDNMEGLSVHRAPGGALVLTLISDDNFSALQRTVLLQFTLE
jgi:hypothetical protein